MSGRKKLFENGLTPLQELVCIDLSLARPKGEVAKQRGCSYEAIKVWLRHPVFQKKLEEYREIYRQNVKEREKERIFNKVDFLIDTAIESLKKQPDRATGVRAAVELAKMEAGYYSGMEDEQRKQVRNLPQSELEKILTAPVLNESNTKTSNTGRTGEKEEGGRTGKV